MTSKNINKGYRLEEMLRMYFIKSGYFTVRGIKLNYKGQDITDIDLWLYSRHSSLTRERVNVDIKNKRSPQVMERIFWTKGLQNVLGLEKAIVATTDKRPEVREFAKKQDVSIIDGYFISTLNNLNFVQNNNRLTDEEFLERISIDGMNFLTGNWVQIINSAKTRLINQLNYSGCLMHLNDAKFFIENSMTDNKRREIACRFFYLITSFLLITIDYIQKDIILLDSSIRAAILRDGFMYGDLGKLGTDQVLSTTFRLIKDYVENGQVITESIKKSIDADYNQLPIDILKEFFSKTEVINNLFSNAIKLESYAYKVNFSNPNLLESDLKSIIGVLIDYFGLERKKFFDVFI